jgi:hypothetical protein
MRSVREQVLQHFPIEAGVRGPDDELKNALYALLWSIDDKDLIVDGWAYFRVIRESKESLDAVGLMTLLPGESVSESVPIEINVKGDEGGFAWSVQIGRLDPPWLALSDSKRWRWVYLYANGDREVPPWTWGRQQHGSVHDTATPARGHRTAALDGDGG